MDRLKYVLQGDDANKYHFIYDVVYNYLEANGIEGWEGFCYGDEVFNISEEYRDIVTIRDGATKVVLVFNKENFVIKIPYYGDYDDSGYTCPYQGGRNLVLDDLGYEFEGNDYCELESALYEEAVECGVEDFFSPTVFFGRISGIPIYIQKKVNANPYMVMQKPSNEELYTYASINNSGEFDSFFGVMLLRSYPIEQVKRFFQFVKKYNINDMDNYRNGGFDIKLGRWIFWDYCGFQE